jgi:hypothetical protein
MKLPFCVACLAKDNLQHHHLITRAEGGSNEETNLITLCTTCHHKLHRRQIDGTYSHHERVRSGQARAKAKGVHIGRPSKLTRHQQKEPIARRDAGLPWRRQIVDQRPSLGAMRGILHGTGRRPSVRLGGVSSATMTTWSGLENCRVRRN